MSQKMRTQRKPAQTPLKKIADGNLPESVHGIIEALLVDHRAFRKLMAKISSSRSTGKQKQNAFKELEKLVSSHVKGEEAALLNLLKAHPKFDHEATEGFEEHRVHEVVLTGIRKVRDPGRKIEQMKIFCEFLEHHLDEEEEDLFPRFKKYAARSTEKKMGRNFLKVRRKTTIGAKKAASRLAP